MTRKQEDLLLFDADGVIVDSFDIVFKDASSFIKEKTGRIITEKQFRSIFKKNPLAMVLKMSGSTKEDLDENKSSLFAHYSQTTIFSGMGDVLRQLSKNNTLGLVTSSLVELVSERLETEDLNNLFAAFLGAKSGVYKDEKIKIAIEEFGSETNQTFFISDTSGDIKEAQKVEGVKTIAVTWGFQDKKVLAKVKPDYIVDTPEELLEVLESKVTN